MEASLKVSLDNNFCWDFDIYRNFPLTKQTKIQTKKRKQKQQHKSRLYLPSLKLTSNTWKLMVGKWNFLFGFRPIFRGKLLVSGRIAEICLNPHPSAQYSCLWWNSLPRETMARILWFLPCWVHACNPILENHYTDQTAYKSLKKTGEVDFILLKKVDLASQIWHMSFSLTFFHPKLPALKSDERNRLPKWDDDGRTVVMCHCLILAYFFKRNDVKDNLFIFSRVKHLCKWKTPKIHTTTQLCSTGCMENECSVSDFEPFSCRTKIFCNLPATFIFRIAHFRTGKTK